MSLPADAPPPVRAPRRRWNPLRRLRPAAGGGAARDTSEATRARVFEHWEALDALCRRRFPNSENVAHEGLMYVLEQLEANDWERVRSWQGEGRFFTYLATMAARLLTDFTRARFGHVRAPGWLVGKEDPVWQAAYRLVAVERQARHEAVEMLLDAFPGRERVHITEVVASVIGHCRRPMHYTDVDSTALDSLPDSGTASTEDDAIAPDRDELSEALGRYLDPASELTGRVGELVSRLHGAVQLDEQDRLLLRLRYVDGLKMTEIVALRGLDGDPYKRYHRIFARLRQALREAGLHDA